MPREKWDALVRGEECPLCIDDDSPELGSMIARLSMSRLVLQANQWVPGYCVLVCKRHVVEPYELSRDERDAFFDDMLRSARAIRQAFSGLKMNYEMLGNSVPHLHCHLTPRFYGDSAPGRPIHPYLHDAPVTVEVVAQRVQAIRAALG